jgi:hypothetical protein
MLPFLQLPATLIFASLRLSPPDTFSLALRRH